MLLKQARLDDIPDKLKINDWNKADRNADKLVIYGAIKDYTPLLEFPNLRHLLVHQATPVQLDVICRLKQLEKLGINWMRSMNSFDCLANLQNLEVLTLGGNFKDVSLEPLGLLSKLRVLSIAALMSTAANCGAIYFENYDPIAKLQNLEYLELFTVKPRNHGLAPLACLRSLKELAIGNSYSLEDYARLAVALPDTKGLFQKPYYRTTGDKYLHCKKCGGTDLVVLFGIKRGAINCWSCDQAKLNKHIAEFEELKRKFQNE